MSKSPTKPNKNDYDPVFLHARREAIIVLALWAAGMAWTVGYCIFTGYNIPVEDVKTTIGVPNWIFWGVLVPWIVIILSTIWFGLFYIADDELVQGQNESDRRHSHEGAQ